MKLLIHDLTTTDKETYVTIKSPDDYQIVGAAEKPALPCIGCFNCWVKHPGECAMKDGYQYMGEYLGNCESCTIITECRYGEFSAANKSLIDRSISTVHPYFVKRKGMTHHKLRYENAPDLHVICYSQDVTKDEKELFRNRVAAMAINLGCPNHKVTFINGIKTGVTL